MKGYPKNAAWDGNSCAAGTLIRGQTHNSQKTRYSPKCADSLIQAVLDFGQPRAGANLIVAAGWRAGYRERPDNVITLSY